MAFPRGYPPGFFPAGPIPLPTRPVMSYSSSSTQTGNLETSESDDADRAGDEMADNARVWREYNKAATEADKRRTDGWSRGVENVGLFAALFAGVTTAFIIESYKNLQSDFMELTYNFLSDGSLQTVIARAVANEPQLQPPVLPPPKSLDRWINCLWLASLLCSLTAALIAAMGKEWIAAYALPDSAFAPWAHRERAELRQFRLDSVRRWRMDDILLFAPVLLQFSLLLFTIGLAVFFKPIDPATGWFTIAAMIIIVVLYLFTTLSPVFVSDSPFRSVLTPVGRKALAFSAWAMLTLGSFASRIATRLFRRVISRGTAGLSRHFLRWFVDPFLYVSAFATFDDWLARSSQLFLRSLLGQILQIAESSTRPTTDRWTSRPPTPDPSVLFSALSWLTSQSQRDTFHAVFAALGDLTLGPHISRRVYKQFPQQIRAHFAILLETPSADKGQLLRTSIHCTTEERANPRNAFESLLLTRGRNKLIARMLGPSNRALKLDRALDEDMLLALCVRGVGVNDDIVWSRLQPGLAIHSVTLERLLHCAAEAKAPKHPLSIALRILHTWKEAFKANPVPLVGPLRRILKAHRLKRTALHHLRREHGRPDEHVDALNCLFFIIKNSQGLGFKNAESYEAIARELLLFILDGGFNLAMPEFLPILLYVVRKMLATQRLAKVSRTILSVLPPFNLSVPSPTRALPPLPAAGGPGNPLYSDELRGLLSQSTTVCISQIVLEILEWNRDGWASLTAERIQVWFCLKFSEAFRTAPRVLDNSSFSILRQLLERTSLIPPIAVRGNRSLDLIYAVANFLAGSNPRDSDSRYQELFHLFVNSRYGGAGGTPNVWSLASELPAIAIGGLLLQAHLVRGVFLALGRLRRQGYGDGDFWTIVAQNVYERSGILAPLSRRRHDRLLRQFYTHMGFTPPLPGVAPPRSLTLREHAEELMSNLRGPLNPRNISLISQDFSFLLRSERIEGGWAIDPELWTRIANLAVSAFVGVVQGPSTATLHSQVLEFATLVSIILCLLKRRGRRDLLGYSTRTILEVLHRRGHSEESPTQIFLRALHTWLSGLSAGEIVKDPQHEHLTQHCVELQQDWCRSALSRLHAGDTALHSRWIRHVEDWLVEKGPCTSCAGRPPAWRAEHPPGRLVSLDDA